MLARECRAGEDIDPTGSVLLEDLKTLTKCRAFPEWERSRDWSFLFPMPIQSMDPNGRQDAEHRSSNST